MRLILNLCNYQVFANCLEICMKPKDRGSCREFTVKWFFDAAYGDCSRFWYGGCEGNENRFKNQDECRKTCVEPAGRGFIFLFDLIILPLYIFFV